METIPPDEQEQALVYILQSFFGVNSAPVSFSVADMPGLAHALVASLDTMGYAVCYDPTVGQNKIQELIAGLSPVPEGIPPRPPQRFPS
jgi:hypothetical protein